ncbi:MAG TPA: NYN domain-containing protein [Nitrospira sp.]|nr:NYN domain-containing protein [Nitrospira sp.]
MHVLIDGYNLLALRRWFGAEPHSDMARESLLRLLAAYRHRKGHLLTVVFDGWQRGQPIEGHEHRAGVHVIYSKRGERADQVIERLAEEYGAECAVVTSDEEVIRRTQAQGALIMRAPEFAVKLQSQISSQSPMVHKELAMDEDVASRRGPEKKGNPRKLPKALRRRGRQLKRF